MLEREREIKREKERKRGNLVEQKKKMDVVACEGKKLKRNLKKKIGLTKVYGSHLERPIEGGSCLVLESS